MRGALATSLLEHLGKGGPEGQTPASEDEPVRPKSKAPQYMPVLVVLAREAMPTSCTWIEDGATHRASDQRREPQMAHNRQPAAYFSARGISLSSQQTKLRENGSAFLRCWGLDAVRKALATDVLSACCKAGRPATLAASHQDKAFQGPVQSP